MAAARSLIESCVAVVASEAPSSAASRRRAVHLLAKASGTSASAARAFFALGGPGALMMKIADDETRRPGGGGDAGEGSSLILASVLPALNDDDATFEHALSLVYPPLTKGDVAEAICALAVLSAIFAANAKLGVSLLQHKDVVAKIGDFAQRAPSRGQAIIASILASATTTEEGRGLIRSTGGVVDALKHFVQSTEPAVRSAASVALTKLNAVKFDSESAEGMAILGAVLNLLEVDSSSESERARGVEAVCFVISDTRVKQSVAFIKDSAVLQSLVEMASSKDAPKSPYAYGLAYVFMNLTMSELEKKREKLREMEVGLKEWEEFEKLTKSQTGGPGEKDTEEQVSDRILAFVRADGVAALVSMIRNGASPAALRASLNPLASRARKERQGQNGRPGSARSARKDCRPSRRR